ncbi:Retrovirus-related Pol polyprotein from type-1 retrotransposable element R1 [Araneus ventricosus]|uniref:Retrovirus-related Pol polyprotein from type-1 retrotransposable element R1 n=1 Tax=Araneus ventricosus TaxID=182803 RepID=A0A4Y2R4K0_ARAVE|nr:Retrovirus-related Pol polyprotein from type-1 retrotransposable element R1 [Araneus ventricosus]
MAQKGAFKTLKKKPKKFAKKFSFWNEDLRISRNKVNKLFKTYRNHRARNSDIDAIQSSGNAYRRERAIFKKLLISAKRKAWEEFCINYNDKYGFLFKLVFNKESGGNSIGVNPGNDPNNSISNKISHIMDFFFPGKSFNDNFTFNPTIGKISSLSIEDLELVLNKLKSGKAPGLDKIDYRMWRAVYNCDKNFMLNLFNCCFRLNYFPRCFRNAGIFFLLKNGRDPSLCNSYRPVCLLPTLGKIVERLFLLKLNGWLDRHNILHNNQYGFREGRSCDLTIQTLVETMKNKMDLEHFALVSLDIKAAFDNMNWSVLFNIFNDIELPDFLKNFIFYYLNDRSISYINDVCECTKFCFKGCPQGSVIAPILWNIYINQILTKNNDTFYTQAFADDLALIVSGRRARDLEFNTNVALAQIAQNLCDLKLTLSVEKCQALVIRSISSQKFSQRNSTVLNRKPTFKINNYSIKVTDSLKILGIVLDNTFTWPAHILTLYDKTIFLTSNFNRVIKSDWSLNKNLLKL